MSAYDYNDFASGRLVSQLSTGTTTGVTVQMNTLNTSSTYSTFPTGKCIVFLVRKNDTATLVEKCIVASGSSQNSTTGVATLGTLTRNISLTDGSDITGSAATITWPGNTLVYVAVSTTELENSAKTNQTNNFGSNVQTLTELDFTSGTAYIKTTDSGANLKFKDGSTAEQTLAVLAAAAGTDHKVLASVTDTTAGYLLGKIPSGSGVTMTQTGGGGNETLVPSINLDTNPGLQLSANKLSVLVDPAGGLSLSSAGLASPLPTGATIIWLTATAPSGWLLCYGQAVSRATYSALFAVISTTYGVGNGTTTFNVPDFRSRVPLGYDLMGGGSATTRTTSPTAASLNESAAGEEKHTLLIGEIPAHTHTYTNYTSTNTDPGGSGGTPKNASSTATGSAGGDGSHNNLQPYLTICLIVKT